jgi:hypothetical protein
MSIHYYCAMACEYTRFVNSKVLNTPARLRCPCNAIFALW